MELKELKLKTEAQLEELLIVQREQLRVMRFKVAQRQLKKVHEIKNTKRNIAKILTVMRDKQAEGKTTTGQNKLLK